ncbi:MAG: hypothetical protein FWD69_08800 [Polyangiaceae bacterium]|nr:hypothetical protein [Polyangiaceae bacterium]
MQAALGRVAVAVLVVLAACTRHDRGPGPAADSGADGVTAAPAGIDEAPEQTPTTRAPLSGHPWIVELVEEHPGRAPTKLGFVTVPLGARERRPVVIALHGGGDRPEWACSEWVAVVSAYPFIVCPRGPGGDEGLSWSHPSDTNARIARALAAARAIFDE